MGIRWYSQLYIGEKAAKVQKKIKWKLEHRAGMLNTYLITMPSNEDNSLDIIHAAYLKQPFYKHRTIRVVGIAVSYEEALQVLIKIVQDVYAQTNGMDIKGYLRSHPEIERWQV